MIETAEPPREPTFPKKGPTVLLATLAALLVSTGIAAAAALVSPDEGVVGDGAPRRPARTPARPPAPERLAGAPSRRAETPRDAGPDEVFGSAEPLADFLLEAADGSNLAVLVAGADSPRALFVALETGRRLSAAGSTVLVDLGLSQDWLADILDRGDDPGAPLPGLVDLLGGSADYGEVLRRDLSSRLDVIPAGGALDNVDGVEAVIAALASSYDYVVLHASDWRSAAARAALARVMAAIVVAPPSRVATALAALRGELGDEAPTAIGFAASDMRSPMERAA